MDVLAEEGERGTISNDREKHGLLSYSCSETKTKGKAKMSLEISDIIMRI